MNYLVIGLGNPGAEYERTRHNVGWIVLDRLIEKGDWELDKYLYGFTAEVKMGSHKVFLLKPTTFMNKSGLSAAAAVKKLKVPAERVIVVQDDLDLSLGAMKIVFNRGSGGHKGIESIKRALKTEGFIRVRLGISPATPGGKLKKPKGEAAVHKLILGKFSEKEWDAFKKTTKKAKEAIETIVTEGLERAMNEFN